MLLGHDCKNCEQDGKCSMQKADSEAVKIYAEGGIAALVTWSKETLTKTPNELFDRVQASVNVMVKVPSELESYRMQMNEAANHESTTEACRKDLPEMFQAMSMLITDSIMKAAISSSVMIAKRLGARVGMTMLRGDSDTGEVLDTHEASSVMPASERLH